MRDKILQIYMKSTVGDHKTILSGVKFQDFVDFSGVVINNILLLSSGDIGQKSYKGFDVLEGSEEVAGLKNQHELRCGDFCFVDYLDGEILSLLTNEEIAELLYLSHMFEPLRTPFFSSLQNKFAYLSHDDGWYCKIYCEDRKMPLLLVQNKILDSIYNAINYDAKPLTKDLFEKIAEFSTEGILLEIELLKQKNKKMLFLDVNLYNVGMYENMDDLFNNLKNMDLHPVFQKLFILDSEV